MKNKMASKNNNNKSKEIIKTDDVKDAVNESVKDTINDAINDAKLEYIESPWSIIGSYFEGQHLKQLVRHQIESYNDFVTYQIQRTIQMFNPVNICSEQDFDKESNKHKLEILITFENFNIYRPQIHENNGATKLMFPHEARLRNFTYASTMTIDINIKYIVRTGNNLENCQTFYKILPKIHIGKLPIMLKSNVCVLNQYKHVNSDITGECKMDPGGYFIINGSEKTVLGQERAAENQIYCFNISKNNTKWSWLAEIKSIPDNKCISPKQISLVITSKSNGFGHSIYVNIPRIKQAIPLFIIFRALKVLTDREICEKIVLDISSEKYKDILEALKGSIIDANAYLDSESALKYIISNVIYTPINMDKETGNKKKREFALDVLNNDLFPHCHNMTEKIYFLGYMANKLLQTSFGNSPCSDRDSYLNKRIDLTGSLLNNLFRNYFNKLVKDMQKQIIREINNGSWRSTEDYNSIINLTNIYKIIKSTTIENGLKRALATGDFGIKQVNSNKVGVAQVLNRLTYIASLSHLRRINTPIDKSGKLIPPRKLHNSSWGFLCPAECFDPETPILMWNGVIKRAGDIIVGDILIDDLGNPTKVRSICSGQKKMYDIIPDKSNFIKHRVTDNHILTLRIRQHKNITPNNRANRSERFIVKYFNRSELKIQEKSLESLSKAEEFVNNFTDDDTLDITIEDYLKLNKYTREHLVVFKIDEMPAHISSDILHRGFESTRTLDDEAFKGSHFKLEEAGLGEFVGWQLEDKRGRFLLSDGLVVHNTPEGAAVGIVKNLSYMTHVTSPSNSSTIYEYVKPYVIPLSQLQAIELYEQVKVFVNGAWIGITNKANELYISMKEKKYKGILNIYISIIFDYKRGEIKICNDAGRLSRPLLRVKNNKLLLTPDIIKKLDTKELKWEDLLLDCRIEDSIIEYVDSAEQNVGMIAMEPDELTKKQRFIYKYTHCEIHPSTIFGIIASCIPFPEHNQSPRIVYQSSMGKQAMGVYVTNYDNRMDKTAYVLNYPMRPLVDTRLMNLIRLNQIPSGGQVIVAIMTHTGYNQEDSVLFNQGSIDRGLFQATIYHTEKDEDKKIHGDAEMRCKPDKAKTKGMKFGNYGKVNSNGVIPENTLVEDRDIIISKVLPIKEARNDHTKVIKYEDQSRIYRTNEETYVDKNYIERNGDGYNFCKVRLRTLRKPVIGDKFCLREDSLVMTKQGWVKLKDIDISKHQVATLKDGEILDYVYPTNKYDFECDQEELYHISSQQIKIICTKNHKLYIKRRGKTVFEFVEAKDIYGKRIQYKKNALNMNDDINDMILGDIKYDMNEFLKLLGAFISDGWVEVSKKYTRICISMTKLRKKIFIEEVLNKLNMNYNMLHNTANDRVMIGNTYKELVDYLKILSVGAANKYLPEFVWNLSQEQSKILLESLIQGDGSYNSQGSCGYYTSSKRLAEDVQRLALHCGWSGTIKLYESKMKGSQSLMSDGRIIKSNYDNLSVRIVKTKNTPTVNHGHTKEQNIQQEEYIKYTGTVSCIEVPDTHLFYYKEDEYSPPCWTGNSSRHGQKGTIGNIIPEADMPFTAGGLKPDIIINPHAIPSRMTIGQLKETLLGKVLIELGLFGDGTSFSKFDIKDICKELQKLGYESNGDELMYNGLTGEQIETSIFIGPAFYQRLKHMVSDKQHSRSIGPMVNLTRQPAEGRSRDGGLRFGGFSPKWHSNVLLVCGIAGDISKLREHLV
jgi:DNA-directed RNA polymerase beta subunit